MLLKSSALTTLTAIAVLFSSGAATAIETSAKASTTGPRLIGTPSARYGFVKTNLNSKPLLDMAAVFRTDRALNLDHFATIAAPKLTSGQTLDGPLFGGTKPGHIGRYGKHCYFGEIPTLGRHTKLGNPHWKLGLRNDDNVVVGPVKSITLLPQTADSGLWELAAAKQLGC